MRALKNRFKEHWAFIPRTDQQNTNLAIFVHGFLGNYLQTWGKLPTFLHQRADESPTFGSWDFLFVGYDTDNVETYLDIAMLICTEWKKARTGEAPYNRPYKRLALFGHSLGTLGIRQMLCASSVQPKDMLGEIKSVNLFGTPLNGSPLAKIASFALRYRIADALKPKNPQLRMLRKWAEGSFEARPWPKARVILGQDDKVVGFAYTELAGWPGDEEPDMTPLDHSDLVKPDSWEDSSVVDFIQRGLQ